jgi:hypothetical protein
MTPQTISLKQVNYQYQHNNYTCAAFIERNERQLNTNWRKKGKKKEKLKMKHSYCIKHKNHGHVKHKIDKGVLYIGYRIDHWSNITHRHKEHKFCTNFIILASTQHMPSTIHYYIISTTANGWIMEKAYQS